jgi:hypothetical protein
MPSLAAHFFALKRLLACLLHFLCASSESFPSPFLALSKTRKANFLEKKPRKENRRLYGNLNPNRKIDSLVDLKSKIANYYARPRYGFPK